MKDNMVKQSIRLFFRSLLLMLKILVSPFHLAVVALGSIFLGIVALKSWATNDEKHHSGNVKELTEFWTDAAKWYKF